MTSHGKGMLVIQAVFMPFSIHQIIPQTLFWLDFQFVFSICRCHSDKPLHRSFCCSWYYPCFWVRHWMDFFPPKTELKKTTKQSSAMMLGIAFPKPCTNFAFAEQYIHVVFSPKSLRMQQPQYYRWVRAEKTHLRWLSEDSFISFELYWRTEKMPTDLSRVDQCLRFVPCSGTGQWSFFKLRMGNTSCTLNEPSVLKDERETMTQRMGLQQ